MKLDFYANKDCNVSENALNIEEKRGFGSKPICNRVLSHKDINRM